jgi:hypothetical protein
VRRISQSDIRQNLLLWTRGTAAREALAHLDRTGIDAEPLLSKAELSRDQLYGSPDIIGSGCIALV